MEEENECEICGNDHETRDCDQSICGKCGEVLDNCDCEEPQELTPEEWLNRNKQ